MARMLRWLLVLTVVLAAAAVVVSADGWIPSFGQKNSEETARDGAARTVETAKSWSDWASGKFFYFPGFAARKTNDVLDASKGTAEDTAANVAGESGKLNPTTVAGTAKEYAAKGLERVTSTKDQLHGATTGFIQRWGSWAKDNVGKYYSYGPLAQKSTDKASDTVKSAASNLDSTADATKETVDTAKEEVQSKTDEKEL